MAHRTLFPPPDEKRALEQLERFHKEILRARRERERAGAEFEGFVEGFREPGDQRPREIAAEPAGRRVPRPVIPAPEQPPAELHAAPGPAATAPPIAPSSEAPIAPVTPAAEPVVSVEPIPALAAPPRSGRRLLLGLVAGFLIGALGALYFWQRLQPPAAPPPAESARSTTPETPAPAQRAPEPQAPPVATRPEPAPAPAVSPSTVQLTTDRTVWMRVIVDGQKVLEREVPAGQRLTYTPAGSLVIRAGDAGGVRVKVGNGPEQVLGRNAFPLTRRFDVPAKP